MKINTTHALAGLALVAFAFWIGKRNGSLAKVAQADANIQSTAQWWNYPGSWAAQ